MMLCITNLQTNLPYGSTRRNNQVSHRNLTAQQSECFHTGIEETQVVVLALTLTNCVTLRKWGNDFITLYLISYLYKNNKNRKKKKRKSHWHQEREKKTNTGKVLMMPEFYFQSLQQTYKTLCRGRNWDRDIKSSPNRGVNKLLSQDLNPFLQLQRSSSVFPSALKTNFEF